MMLMMANEFNLYIRIFVDYCVLYDVVTEVVDEFAPKMTLSKFSVGVNAVK